MQRNEALIFAEGWIHLSGWQLGQPLELLPVLRIQYPGGIREEIQSICLLNQERSWFLRIIESPEYNGLSRRDIDLLPLVDDGDNYDYSDCLASEPMYVIDGLLTSTDKLHAARLLDIFTPATLSFIERFDKRAYLAKEDAKVDESAKVRFLLRCAAFLAKPLADQVSLSELAIANLKGSPGVADGLFSHWDTLVEEWRGGNGVLSETWRADLRDATAEAFRELPHPQQLALWLSHRRTSDGLKELVENETFLPELTDIKLFDIDLLFADAEPSILHALNEEACRRASEGKSTQVPV